MPDKPRPNSIIPADETLKQSAAYINAEHGAAEQAGRASVIHACEYLRHAANAGEELLRVKDVIGHGTFMEWVQQNLVLSHRTATRYMQKAREALEAVKLDSLSNLTPDKAIGMLQETPDEGGPEAPPGEENAAPGPQDGEENGTPTDDTSEDDEPEAEDEAAPPPTHPHSDMLLAWLDRVSGQPIYIDNVQGGIPALLAEPDRWDWRAVRGVILPKLESLLRTLGTYFKELDRHANARPQGGR